SHRFGPGGEAGEKLAHLAESRLVRVEEHGHGGVGLHHVHQPSRPGPPDRPGELPRGLFLVKVNEGGLISQGKKGPGGHFCGTSRYFRATMVTVQGDSPSPGKARDYRNPSHERQHTMRASRFAVLRLPKTLQRPHAGSRSRPRVEELESRLAPSVNVLTYHD